MSPSKAAIELNRISKRFGHRTALQNINLSVSEGESLVFFGPNGAGKTTLLKIVVTLAKPSEGEVLIRGIDAKVTPEKVRAEIGLISHQTLLYEDLTANENLTFYGRMYGLESLDERIQEILQDVGLQNRSNDRVRDFSRGMKQRLAIARATLHHPKILLLDEPFTGLDTSARIMLTQMLQGLRKQGRTLLLVTHDLQQGIQLADRYMILNHGRTVSQSSSNISTEDMQREYESRILPTNPS